MTDRPIILRDSVIAAIRAGTARHICLPASFVPGKRTAVGKEARAHLALVAAKEGLMRLPTVWVKLQPGDRLWVQEEMAELIDLAGAGKGSKLFYRMELVGGRVPIPGSYRRGRWDTATHDAKNCDRELSRFTLVVTRTYSFPVQGMTWETMQAEGARARPFTEQERRAWWDMRYGATMPWEENPHAVSVSFDFVDGNIDTGERWVSPPAGAGAASIDRMFGTRPVND